jgi:hypothetical protein
MSLIHSEQVGKLQLNKKEISGFIDDQITRINSAITTHQNQLGVNYIFYELPRHSFNGTSLVDSQRIIASELIKKLLDKKYKVKILLDDCPRLAIKWIGSINRDDIEGMNTFIKEHKIDNSKLEDFLAKD